MAAKVSCSFAVVCVHVVVSSEQRMHSGSEGKQRAALFLSSVCMFVVKSEQLMHSDGSEGEQLMHSDGSKGEQLFSLCA